MNFHEKEWTRGLHFLLSVISNWRATCTQMAIIGSSFIANPEFPSNVCKFWVVFFLMSFL